MEYTEISIEVPKEIAEEVSGWFWERELPFETMDETTLDPPALGWVRFRSYVPLSQEKEAISLFEQEPLFQKTKLVSVRRDTLEWQDAWKRFFHTRILGRFAIVPSWEERSYQSQPKQIRICLDPGRAFGTGGHPSTRMCLQLLDEATTQAMQVLDVGCGCGILAIAALLANPQAKAVAMDIDPEAVEVTKENAERNQVLSQMQLTTEPLKEIPGQYSLVLANLTGPTLQELAPLLISKVERGGYLILSGILEIEAETVLNKFLPHGFVLNEQKLEEEWVAFRLKRK